MGARPAHAAAGARLVKLGADGGPLSKWEGVCHGAMLVAAGTVDVFFHMSAGPWDIAAAVPVIEEAGGMFSDLDGSRSISSGAAVYCNGNIHREVIDLLRSTISAEQRAGRSVSGLNVAARCWSGTSCLGYSIRVELGRQVLLSDAEAGKGGPHRSEGVVQSIDRLHDRFHLKEGAVQFGHRDERSEHGEPS